MFSCKRAYKEKNCVRVCVWEGILILLAPLFPIGNIYVGLEGLFFKLIAPTLQEAGASQVNNA